MFNKIPNEIDGNNALLGTPMGDWLFLVLEQDAEKCYGDPEYCVSASCVVCPECSSTDTVRITPPDEENVSEFECLDCECFFTAINPKEDFDEEIPKKT